MLVAWKGLEQYGATRRPDDGDPEAGAAPPDEGEATEPGDPGAVAPVLG